MRDLNIKKTRGIRPRNQIKLKKHRPSEGMMKFKKTARVMLVVLAAVAVGAGGGYGARSIYDGLLSSDLFAIKSIEVSGGKRLSREKILSLAGIREGQNIFRVDAEQAVNQIASHPWVKGVTVRRQFPDRVIIRVVEREAQSLVRKSGLWLMDETGVAFKPVQTGDPIDMPVITGPGEIEGEREKEMMQRALAHIERAENSDLLPAAQISEIIISPLGRITLFTTGALERVDFGKKDIDSQWAMLEAVLADVKRSGLEVVSVNLNHTRGAAVRIKKADPSTLVADVQSSDHMAGHLRPTQ